MIKGNKKNRMEKEKAHRKSKAKNRKAKTSTSTHNNNNKKKNNSKTRSNGNGESDRSGGSGKSSKTSTVPVGKERKSAHYVSKSRKPELISAHTIGTDIRSKSAQRIVNQCATGQEKANAIVSKEYLNNNLISASRKALIRSTERKFYIRPINIARNVLPLEPSLRTLKALTSIVKFGNTPEVAARACGVPLYIFKKWLKIGVDELRNPDRPENAVPSLYGALVLALDAADAQDECTDIMLITSRINSWQALAWKRERKSAARWGTKVETRIGGVADAPIEIETAKKEQTLDQTAEILAVLAETGAMKYLGTTSQIAADDSSDDDSEDEVAVKPAKVVTQNQKSAKKPEKKEKIKKQ